MGSSAEWKKAGATMLAPLDGGGTTLKSQKKREDRKEQERQVAEKTRITNKRRSEGFTTNAEAAAGKNYGRSLLGGN